MFIIRKMELTDILLWVIILYCNCLGCRVHGWSLFSPHVFVVTLMGHFFLRGL
jgi:hypothetical protein